MAETRPAPAWLGDVAAGVAAWQASTPPPEDEGARGPDADPEAVARKILLDQLTGRARSRSELASKLATRKVPDEIAIKLLDRFEELGLINDAAFAQEWVLTRSQVRGLAPSALSQELRRKGVAGDVITEALSLLSQDDQREAAQQLVRRKLRSMSRLDHTVATRRLAGMLARKGYPSELVFSVIREELHAELESVD